MNSIIETVTAWPVIVQGALGSALFALFSFAGQKSAKFLFSKWDKYRKNNHEILVSQKAALIQSYLDKDLNLMSSALSLMILSSLHYLMKAALFILLGSILDTFIPVFGFVGYFIGFLFLFKAMSYSPHMGFLDEKSEAELKEIQSKLEAEAN